MLHFTGCPTGRTFLVQRLQRRREPARHLPSVFDRDGVEAAPQIPGCNRTPGLPVGSEPVHGPRRNASPGEIPQRYCLLQPKIVQRQHVWSQQAEDQDHFGGPAAHPPQARQLLDYGLVIQRRPMRRIHSARREMPRESQKVLGLTPRQTAALQACSARLEHGLRAYFDQRFGQALPDGVRGLDRNLLPDDRARESPESVAPPVQRCVRVGANDRSENGIPPRERAPCTAPVCRNHTQHFRPGTRLQAASLASARTRLCEDTCWTRKSIWSARILRLVRIRYSALFGT